MRQLRSYVERTVVPAGPCVSVLVERTELKRTCIEIHK